MISIQYTQCPQQGCGLKDDSILELSRVVDKDMDGSAGPDKGSTALGRNGGSAPATHLLPLCSTNPLNGQPDHAALSKVP
jgi:hypothetical protein